MTPLERAKAALQTANDPDRRVDLVMPDRPLGLRLRPSDWDVDQEIFKTVAAKNSPREQLDISSIHVAAHIEAVFGLDDKGDPASLYDDGSEALLNERLGEAFGYDPDAWVSSAHLLLKLIGEGNTEDVYFVHRNWSGHSQNTQVRRLGEPN